MENRYAQFITPDKKESTFSKVVDPAASAVGAAAGFLLTSGNPAGAIAGAKIGHSVGNAAQAASNGQLTPETAAADTAGAYKGWQAMSPLFFAEGGMVPTGDQWDFLQQAIERSQMPQEPRTQPDMTQMPGLLQQAAGPPIPDPKFQTAKHPTLEMLATIIPQVLAAMPKPVKPNNRAIGTWLPAIGTAMAAPAAYARGKRDAANAAARNTYDAQVEARNKIMAGAAPSIAARLSQEPKPAPATPYDEQLMDEARAIAITGDKRWAGKSLKDYNAYLDRIKAFKTGGGTAGNGTSGGAGKFDDKTKALGDAIAEGRVPPSALGSRMTQQSRPLWEYLATKMDANGVPLDVAKMVREWEAGGKFLGAMNSRISIQQRGAAVTLFNTLDAYDKIVDSVGSRVPQGPNRPMNELIQVIGRNSNLYGPEANSMLRQLSGADKTIVSELAQVLSAGGVPTDEARRLAAQEVNQYWGKMPVKKALQQIKHFTRLRLQASFNQAPFTMSSEIGDLIQEPDMWNPGGVPADTPPAPQTRTFRGEDGRVLTIPVDKVAKFRARFPRAVEVTPNGR